MAKKPVGWRREPARHALAAKGVRSKTAVGRSIRTSKTSRKNIFDAFWNYRWEYVDSVTGEKQGYFTPAERANYFRFIGVPGTVARDLLNANPAIVNLHDAQGDSPEMFEMLVIAMRNRGTLEGYVIPPESGRSDARITFDGINIPDESVAHSIAKKYHPNEFSKESGGWRLWWD